MIFAVFYSLIRCMVIVGNVLYCIMNNDVVCHSTSILQHVRVHGACSLAGESAGKEKNGNGEMKLAGLAVF